MPQNDSERATRKRPRDLTAAWIGAGAIVVSAVIGGIFLLAARGEGNPVLRASESERSLSAKHAHSYGPRPTRPSGSRPASQPVASASTGPPIGVPLTGPDAPPGVIVEGGGMDLRTDATGVSINGQIFANSFEGLCEAACSDPETLMLPLDLDRKYDILKARFGVADNSLSSTDSATIEVIADGDVIYDHAFSLGHSQDVSLNVSGILRLTFQFTGNLEYVYPAVGDPTVYG
jgi:NPCBM/NEW2 domain